jgi:hypothetical protein
MKAFPDRYYTRLGDHVVHEGMDLRDYFAAKAMQALITTFDFKGTQIKDITPIRAYEIADAMMEARK